MLTERLTTESVSVGARGDVAVGVVLNVWVGDTGERSFGEGVGLIFLSIGNGDGGGGKNRSVVKAEDVEIDGFGDGVVPSALPESVTEKEKVA